MIRLRSLISVIPRQMITAVYSVPYQMAILALKVGPPNYPGMVQYQVVASEFLHRT